MTAVTKGCLRQYKRLPVYIEEDHNEVVPHIHRAIASRHLPMSGIPMVHFDSHPDLLLPLHMQADHVFDREQLYSELSIENWILPLAYAGHISEVYWLKPPWSDQISDTWELCFTVGKHTGTGEIRISLDDPYFLTEALYAPESHLTNAKLVTLHVITVTPSNWRAETPNFKDRRTRPAANQSGGNACHIKNVTEQSTAQSTCHTLESTQTTERPPVSIENNGQCRSVVTSDTKTQVTCSLTSSEDLSPPKAKMTKTDSCEDTFCCHIKQVEPVDDVNSQQHTLDKKLTFNGSQTLLDKSWIVKLKQKLQGHPYILDIDLDFFSTKDPFQNDCSAEQAALLQQLFEFRLPVQKTEKDTLEFSQARQAQLDELFDVFQQLQQQPESVPKVQDPHRQMVLQKFLQLLPKSSSKQSEVDFEMLYRAGCTFDGSALPHHVSSSHQIEQLMDTTADILRSLPSPTIVTVSRSSVDDYCPQDQVEMIQENLMKVLNGVYKDTDVHKLYEQQQ